MSTDDLRIDRRKFLGGAAGVAGAAAFATWSPWAQGRPGGPTAPIIGKAGLACQHFSVRDATTRVTAKLPNGSVNPNAIMGYLGGPNFPQDPTDLGPLVPLPGGYQEVFQFLGECGYGGFEFFQLSQNAQNPGGANPGTTAIRGWLDAAGLKSIGTHQGGLTMFTQTPNRPAGEGTINANGLARIAEAQVLGHTMIGTAGDPSGSNLVSAWRDVCLNYSKMGELMLENYGIKVYLHPEQNNWNFIADPAVPVAERQHRIDFWVANTDPRYVFIEPDLLHMYNARARFPNPDGSLWDPIAYMQNNWKRLVGWHVKDATRVVTPVAPPGNGWEQTRIRPGFPLNGGQDVIYSTEGHLGNGSAPAAQAGFTPTGYGFDPGSSAPAAQPGVDPRVWSFRREFTEIRSNRSKGFKYHIVETDNGATSPATLDPGRSLRHAKISAKLLLGLK